jgi:alpha-glucoside transport system permease protein
MTAVSTPTVRATAKPTAAAEARKWLTSSAASIIAIILAVLWTIPTFGLLITSIRPPLSVRQSGWWTWFTNPEFTFENYDEVLFGSTTNLATYFVNSLVIAIPSVVIPLTLATMAAYGFAWTRFRGRDVLFVAVFALQIVPLQIALLPLLRIFVDRGLAGTFWPVWIAHSIFALPLAVFLLHNFMREIPSDLVEAARVDGAGHVRIFLQIMLPLIVPVIAAFGIFQFLWVWNDLLVALTFSGGTPDVAPLTVRVAELSGTRGTAWHLLSAGAFVSIIVPLIVFVAGQRYFVRGLLAGSVKG